MGAFSCSKDLHGQLGVPDPAADESCIKYQRFYKTIPGTTHDLVFFRFTDSSGGISTAVDGKTLVVAVNKKTGNTRKQLYDHFTAVR